MQLFHAHLTSVPGATVFVAGLNALFVTDIPPAGAVVLPLDWLFGAVEPPLPPHPMAEIRERAIQAFLVVMFSLFVRFTL